jgi:hypothetical protein
MSNNCIKGIRIAEDCIILYLDTHSDPRQECASRLWLGVKRIFGGDACLRANRSRVQIEIRGNHWSKVERVLRGLF